MTEQISDPLPNTRPESSPTPPTLSRDSGKMQGTIHWWLGRSTLEKLLLITILLLLCVVAVLVFLVVRFASDARAAEKIMVDSSAAGVNSTLSTESFTTPALPLSPSPTTTTPSSVPTTASPEPPVCTTQACVKAANYFISASNFSADPCDNFFEYACGRWNYENSIPDDTSVHGTFFFVRDLVRQQLRVSLESESAKSPSRAINMAKAHYRLCMNVTQLEDLGSKPMLEVMEELGGWPVLQGLRWTTEQFNLTQALAKARRAYDMDAFFVVSVFADSKNTTKNTLIIDQGTLTFGRGSRDYYLNQTLFHAHLQAYQKFMRQIIKILSVDMGMNETAEWNATVASTIENIIAFETEIAKALIKITTSEDDRRNSTRQYNKMEIGDLYDLMPQVDWVVYITQITPTSVHDIISNSTQIIVQEVDFMKKLSSLLEKQDSRLLANYILWRVVCSGSKLLDDRYEDARHEWNKVLTGQQMRSARWKECAMVPNMVFPYAAGAIYVNEHFDSNDKKEAMEMISNIREAFKEMVMENEWMDGETKKIAIQKVENVIEMIGYPDLLNDPKKLDDKYEGLELLSSDTYFSFMKKFVLWSSDRDFNKLKKPFDKYDFEESAAIVNAFYSPEKNSITFPAGILQPPFFAGNFPKAVNYGAIGSVIGHEITHGFDDVGSQYDKNGNLVNWWNENSQEGFSFRKECVIQQYSSFVVPDTNVTVNGRLTLGENIADNGGVKEAYRAYRKYIQVKGEEPRLPGLQHLTNDQIFFLAYAHFWCGNKTLAAALQQALTDEHSPEIFRVIGVLSNFPAFSDAFKCPTGSRLNPRKKCTVW